MRGHVLGTPALQDRL